MMIKNRTDGVYLDRGGDLSLTCRWVVLSNGVRTPTVITGETFTPYEVVPPALAAGMTIEVVDGPNGVFRVFRAWDDDWPEGVGPIVSFRGQSASGNFTIPMVKVVLK